ncbi:hypothetical protein [Yinghuangia sp. YIM S09857]|uniref:hypothetical protein n=1 Tax=Yinghuangia sp. YIM S09857 TaxID=3436929 RepID=UPI003F52C775
MVTPKEPNLADVPAWPVLTVELRTDGYVVVEGETIPVAAGDDARQTAVEVVAATATLIGRPVRVEAREPDGTVWPLIVTPDARVVAAGASRNPIQSRRRRGLRRGSQRRPAANSHTGVPVPPPAPGAETRSAPDPDTQATLARILSDLRNGRTAAARSRAQSLVDRLDEGHGRTSPAASAGREVLAFTSFVNGDVLGAATLYAELAMSRPNGEGPVDERIARWADNAQFSWSQATYSAHADRVGRRVLAMRVSGWGPASAEADAVIRRLSQSPVEAQALPEGDDQQN